MGRMLVENPILVLSLRIDGCGQGEVLKKNAEPRPRVFTVMRLQGREGGRLRRDVAHAIQGVGQVAEWRVEVGGDCSLGGESCGRR